MDIVEEKPFPELSFEDVASTLKSLEPLSSINPLLNNKENVLAPQSSECLLLDHLQEEHWAKPAAFYPGGTESIIWANIRHEENFQVTPTASEQLGKSRIEISANSWNLVSIIRHPSTSQPYYVANQSCGSDNNYLMQNNAERKHQPFSVTSQDWQLNQKISFLPQQPAVPRFYPYRQSTSNSQDNLAPLQWSSSIPVYPTQSNSFSEWHTRPTQPNQHRNMQLSQDSTNAMQRAQHQHNMYQVQAPGGDGNEQCPAADASQEFKPCRYGLKPFELEPEINHANFNFFQIEQSKTNNTIGATSNEMNHKPPADKANKGSLNPIAMGKGEVEAESRNNKRKKLPTFRCTACKYGFTSLGHLNRHYKSNIHKKAVMFSQQPRPANLFISTHHADDTESNASQDGLFPRSQHIGDGNEVNRYEQVNRTSGGIVNISYESHD